MVADSAEGDWGLEDSSVEGLLVVGQTWKGIGGGGKRLFAFSYVVPQATGGRWWKRFVDRWGKRPVEVHREVVGRCRERGQVFWLGDFNAWTGCEVGACVSGVGDGDELWEGGEVGYFHSLRKLGPSSHCVCRGWFGAPVQD